MPSVRKAGAVAATLALGLLTLAAGMKDRPSWMAGGRTKQLTAAERPVIHDETNPFMLKVRGTNTAFSMTANMTAAEAADSAKELGPENDHDTYISLINATPYEWHRGYNSSYQLKNWSTGWPKRILSGQSHTMVVRRARGSFPRDSAGDVIYHLKGTKKPMSFMVRYTPGIKDGVSVQFLEQLQTLNNAKNTLHKLGFNRIPGGVGFILAGTEGDFLSNDPPLGWMQAQLHEIGDLPLKEIAMPRSHHAGQWKNEESVGFATPANTQTHRLPLEDQLGNGGIRVLDVRPVLRHKLWRESHGGFIGPYYHGMMGATIREMVGMVNTFLEETKGELVIFDIFDQETRNGDSRFRPVNDDELKILYKELMKLKHLIAVPEDHDLTEWPLRRFLNIAYSKHNKVRSAVLIRVHPSWAARKHFPGSKKGFVTGVNLPLKSRWSDVGDVKKMATDQITSLKNARPNRNATLYNVDWLLTQKSLSAVFPLQSIMTMALQAWRAMYDELWGALTDQTYPNLLTVDNIHGNEHKTFVMAINKCLAARKCGDLGGKVQVVNDTNMAV